MYTRRDFLVTGVGAGTALLLASGNLVFAASASDPVKEATAITQVFGNGLRLTAVALEYDRPIDSSKLSPAAFKVDGRTITKVYANTAAALSDASVNGKYVILELSPDDADARLYALAKRDVVRKEAKATITQTGDIVAADGETVPASADPIQTSAVSNLIVDDFQQLAYTDPKTGDVLHYNLFVPRNYDKSKSYPLVLFMHDAGATSDIVNTTLVQGLGAVVWASPEDQAKREAFVLAPQYASQLVNDASEATADLDRTVDIIHQLMDEYSIDPNRLYTTGQSGGAMASIALDIKYPDLFAASFIVAGQWDPEKVKPLANDKLWIMVSEGDLKAYPGENAITAVLEKEGARISRAVWDGRSTPEEFSAAFAKIDAEGSPINYVVLKKGTVALPGQEDDGGSNHVNTWRIAYTIEEIRDWMFRQHK